jgi:hypothetical protein
VQAASILTRASTPTENIADSEVLDEVSQIVLKIDFALAVGTTPLLH